MSGIKNKMLNLIEAGNDTTGDNFTNLTDVIQALIDGYGGTAKWYSHYKSHVSAIDGLYSGFNYSNVHVVNNHLVIGYLAMPHHYTSLESCVQVFRVAKINLSTGVITERDAITGMGWCGSVYYNGNYYIFDSFGHRYVTTDWETFEQGTYTIPSGGTEPYYITVGDNGRFISTISTYKKGWMIYSDDLGLTWTRASGGNSAYTDHGGTCKVGNTLVAYCSDSAGSGFGDDSPNRWVLTSVDNGETWSEKLCVNQDLLKCGTSHASGSFARIGDDWFYLAGKRLKWTDENGIVHLGAIQLFKGTAQDVIDGTMSLYTVVDDLSTEKTGIYPPDSLYQTDTGNLGMATDGSKLFCVYMRPLFHVQPNGGQFNTSNCMVTLAVVDTDRKGTNSSDDYYNPNWQTEMETELSAKDTTHDFYIYADGNGYISNYLGTILSKSTISNMGDGFVQPSQTLSLPFVNEFEMCFIGRLREVLVDGNYINNYLGANINGEEVCLTGTTNNLYLNKANTTNGAAALAALFGGDVYFKIKYENGIVSVSLDGTTINNIKTRYYSSYNSDNDTVLFRCKELADGIINSGRGWGTIKSFWIDSDGDLSDLIGYSVENNLTNVTSNNDAQRVEKNSSYTAIITPNAGCQIDSVSVLMGGVDVTSTVYNNGVISIPSVTGNVVITITGEVIKTLTSIDAVYTQTGDVYDTDTLDYLRTDLIVTAHYDNQTSETISDYTLSGTLATGTSTVTVNYEDKSTTFTVTVTHAELPRGFTAYDYLTLTLARGAEYHSYAIIANATIDITHTIEYKLRLPSGQSNQYTWSEIFGTRDGNSGSNYIAASASYSNRYAKFIIANNIKQANKQFGLGSTVTLKLLPVGKSTTYPSNNVIVTDTTEFNTNLSITSFTPSPWFGIFGVATSETSRGNTEFYNWHMAQLGEIKIYDANDSIIYHFIPAKDANDNYGYYEKVNKQFYYHPTYAKTAYIGGMWT